MSSNLVASASRLARWRASSGSRTFTPWTQGPIYRIVLACACSAAVEV
jgi:hypothetical protein